MAASLGAAFLKTRPELETPDIQFHLQPFSATRPADGPHPFCLYCLCPAASPGKCRFLSWLLAIMTITQDLSKLSQPPRRYTLVEGIRIARKICKNSPVKEQITSEFSPGAEVAMIMRYFAMGFTTPLPFIINRHLQDGHGQDGSGGFTPESTWY